MLTKIVIQNLPRVRRSLAQYARVGWTLVLSAVLAAGPGCSTTHFKKSADREVYGIIKDKSPDVPNMTPEFTIEANEKPELDGLPLANADDDYSFLGATGELEKQARVISLERALEIAVQNNRQYQNQKELLYLSALALTLERYQYAPIFSAGGGADYNRSTTDVTKSNNVTQLAQAAPGLVREVGAVVGTPGELLNRYAQLVESSMTASGLNQPRQEIMNERSVSGDTSVGVSMLMKGGMRIALELSSDFLRFLTGDDRVSTSSQLVGTISRPLLRGGGSKAAAERLRQAERDVLYQIREFTNFRKQFVVDIAANYYRVLQSRDVVRNNYQSYRDFQQIAERQRAFAEAGIITEADLGRTRQEELSSEDNWTNAISQYRDQLDRFKIQLGLPTAVNVVLDDNELRTLIENGIGFHPRITDEEAVQVAMAARLDLYTVRDEVEDAERRVYVATNSLKPDLNLLVSGTVNSPPEDDRFQELDFKRARWSAGFDLDLPLDRKSERNAYRRAVIDFERSMRELTLAEDNVALQVRSDWRNLERAKRSYEIRLVGVEVSSRRVEEQTMLREAGQATTLDTIDAQNALTSARNALTAALVDHKVALLEFWRDMGILYVKENGNWEDIRDTEVVAPEPVDNAPDATNPLEVAPAEAEPGSPKPAAAPSLPQSSAAEPVALGGMKQG